MKNLIDNEDFVHRSIPYIIATIFIAAITSVILQVAFFGYICYYIISNSTYVIASIGSVINEINHMHYYGSGN